MALLLLDLDDTLIDRRASFRAWALAFSAGHDLPHDAVRALEELDADGYTPRPEFFAGAMERFALTRPLDEMLARFPADFATFTQRPSERSVALLQELRSSGWRIAVVTNGSPMQEQKIEVAGVAPLLDAVLISDLEGIRKPERAIFQRAAERCGVPLTSGWMVGDHPELDILGGARCGLSTIWLRHDREWIYPTHAPTLTVDTLDEALQHLQALAPS